MRSSTGRWASGDDFFDRAAELQILESRICDFNHVLLTGQRRMGKTSMARELGRRLETKGWVMLFADVEDATCAEDTIATIAAAVHPVRPIASRFAAAMQRWVQTNVEELSAYAFRVKIRAGLSEGSWRGYGAKLLGECARHDQPVLLVIDELPIFLKRMLRHDNGKQRVDEWLSWLRSVLQGLSGKSLSLIVSGSIGLQPLVQQLGLSDRIHYLYMFRLGPWSRDSSIACFHRLAASHDISVADGVADAVYDALGLGVPHHVQSVFARLQDFVIMQERDQVSVQDVHQVYRHELLVPAGQNDLVHYETHLKEGLGDEKNHAFAMEILAEAATQESFTPDARHCLARLYSTLVTDAPERIANVLDVLEHDGYLESGDNGHRVASKLLKDWWETRFRDHHLPLVKRVGSVNA